MKLLLLLPLLLGFSVPAIAHNEYNCSDGACGNHFPLEEGEGADFFKGGVTSDLNNQLSPSVDEKN